MTASFSIYPKRSVRHGFNKIVRDSVVERLNKGFSKPWFGAKKDGTVEYDLGDMTYEEVAVHLVLMFVSHQSHWSDMSLRNLVGDWLRCVEERSNLRVYYGFNLSSTHLLL